MNPPSAPSSRPPFATGKSLLGRLARDPARFRFDAMVRILMRAARVSDPACAMRFRTPPGLAFPAAEVLDVRHGNAKPDAVVGLMGLTGPSGVLPRYYSEMVSQTLRGGSTALHQFVDMLGERFIGFFALAAVKYRPARAADIALLRSTGAPDDVSQVLLALTGYGMPNMARRFGAGIDPLLHYAGLFAMRPRSADRLKRMLSDWLGMDVEVQEFTGAWLQLPPDQRTRIGADGAFCQLGIDAAVGVRAWSPEARFSVRIGALTRKEFHQMLPDGRTMQRLVSLIRAFVGVDVGFAVNPILAGTEVFEAGEDSALSLRSTAETPPRLGWNTWLPISSGSVVDRNDAADAVFDADAIEGWSVVSEAPA